MGEYATYLGREIKIGTCENMFYLRWDQAHRVTSQSGNVDPVRDRNELRFRFPFPEEDRIEPGAFEDHAKRRRIHGVTPPDIDHYSIQLRAEAEGYNLSIPCPEGPVGDKLTLTGADGVEQSATVHRNGFRGAMFLVQQRWWNGLLVSVCECACGAKYRLETLADAQPVIDSLMAEAAEEDRVAERHNTPGNGITAERIRELARRIEAGYLQPIKEDAR